MRPIKLIMSAFGSYAGVEEIDFTKIRKRYNLANYMSFLKRNKLAYPNLVAFLKEKNIAENEEI